MVKIYVLCCNLTCAGCHGIALVTSAQSTMRRGLKSWKK